jgi:hypothetical protein
MPGLTQDRLLSSARFNRIIGRLAAILDIERPLVWLDRLPLTPAFDDELTGRFTGKVIAADIIADDQEAVVQESLSLDVVTHAAPNVKIGNRLGQKLLAKLAAWEQGLFRSVGGEDALRDWENDLAAKVVLGVRQRMNAMACAMFMDSFTYDRFGVKITGATWGMPSNLKVTPGVTWATSATATPLSDIWAIDQLASLTYGITFDTVTMSTADFRDMVNTTEFANKATLNLGAYFLTTPAALPTKQDPRMKEIAGQVLGKTIVLDDAVYNERANDGTLSQTRVLPLHKVVLSRSSDEGNGEAYDMANGRVTEAMVADLVGGGMVGGNLAGDAYGPVGYYTGRPDLNPPDAVAWGVCRCFPRKYLPEASAVLTVG